MSNVSRSSSVRFLAACALLAATLGVGCSQGAPREAREASRARGAVRAPKGEVDDASAKGDDGIVSWSATLDEDGSVLPEFERRAQAYGCATRHERDAVVAACDAAPIMVVQKGREVAIGCKRVSLEDCHALFDRIVGSESAREPREPAPVQGAMRL